MNHSPCSLFIPLQSCVFRSMKNERIAARGEETPLTFLLYLVVHSILWYITMVSIVWRSRDDRQCCNLQRSWVSKIARWKLWKDDVRCSVMVWTHHKPTICLGFCLKEITMPSYDWCQWLLSLKIPNGTVKTGPAH